MIVAGEASGDLHAAGLATALKERQPDWRLTGMGGARMVAAGVDVAERTDTTAVMGFVEVLRTLPRHYALLKAFRRRLESGVVNCLVPIDYPGFNLRLAAAAKAARVPVLYYITPQVWAWGADRLPKMAQVITKAAVILPFEEELLRSHGIDATFVGHPLLDVKVIHLVRDPRGNSASIMKHAGVDADTAARQWTHANVEAARVKRYLPQGSWMSLHYEALCRDPGGVLGQISEFLGIGPMVQDGFRNADSHIIGNKMRMKGLAEIREDLSWQTTLDSAALSSIARIAGSASHAFGYSWP